MLNTNYFDNVMRGPRGETLLYVHFSIAMILMGKRELITLLGFSSRCLVIVVWIFLAVPWVCLRFVIGVFADHTILVEFTIGSKKHNNMTLSKKQVNDDEYLTTGKVSLGYIPV